MNQETPQSFHSGRTGVLSKYTFYPPLKKEIKINQFTINVIKIDPFVSAILQVILYDLDEKPVDSRMYQLVGQDYLDWKDDSYLVNYVKTKLQQESQN